MSNYHWKRLIKGRYRGRKVIVTKDDEILRGILQHINYNTKEIQVKIDEVKTFPYEMVAFDTFWRNTKTPEKVKILNKAVPIEGTVKGKPALERYRKFSNAYYRFYNDGDSYGRLAGMFKHYGLTCPRKYELDGYREHMLEELGELVVKDAWEEHKKTCQYLVIGGNPVQTYKGTTTYGALKVVGWCNNLDEVKATIEKKWDECGGLLHAIDKSGNPPV